MGGTTTTLPNVMPHLQQVVRVCSLATAALLVLLCALVCGVSYKLKGKNRTLVARLSCARLQFLAASRRTAACKRRIRDPLTS